MCTTGGETQSQKQQEFSRLRGPRRHLLMVPLGGVRMDWLVLLDLAPGLLPWNSSSLTPAGEEGACCLVYSAHRPLGGELALTRAPRAPSCPQHWTGRWMRKLCPVKDLPRSGRCHKVPLCTSPMVTAHQEGGAAQGSGLRTSSQGLAAPAPRCGVHTMLSHVICRVHCQQPGVLGG